MPDIPFDLLERTAKIRLDHSIKYREKPPQPAQNGRPISLLTNYFMMQFKFMHTIFVHHYDVSIEKQDSPASGDEEAAAGNIPGPRRRSRKLEKRFNRKIIDKMAADYGRGGGLFDGIIPVYDSDKNMYTKKKLDSSSKFAATDDDGFVNFRIPVRAREFDDDEEVSYIVALKHVAEVEINPDWDVFPQDAIQFVDIVLRYGPTSNKIPVGCKIFFPNPQRRTELPMHKELAFGFYQSARNCEAGLMLNVDRAASVFHTGGSLLSVLKDIFKGIERFPRIPPDIIRKMTNELKGMRVKVTHLRYPLKIRVNDFSRQPASELTFQLEEKDETGRVVAARRITVEDYFREAYRELRHSNLPCLVAGSKKNPKYFPLEVCELLPDQYVAKKLHADVQAAMTSLAAAQRPNARFNEITDSLKNSILKDGRKYNDEFGIVVNPTPVQIEGRVQRPPALRYGNNTRFEPDRDCAWMMQKPSSKHFYACVPIENWILVDMSGGKLNDQFTQKFSSELRRTAQGLGVQISPERLKVQYTFVNTEKLKRDVFERARQSFGNVQLMVFIIPFEDKYYYAVKRLGDLDFGIVTQCVSMKHYNPSWDRCNLLKVSYLTNLMLKINAKMNGLNSVLDVKWAENKKIMFVGVDVTHPAPGDRYSLSIASCVGSYDTSFVRYIAKLMAQEQTKREIVNLDTMMRELLECYKKHNGSYPDTILIYRDGVSEGQFDQVMSFEVTQLLNLFKGMGYSPRISYIVVQKRHHTRFLTVNQNEATRSSNVPAGTTVDTIITDPLKYDFFICSHNGLLGTSRPSRYWVLFDQNNFAPDLIQMITYYMCFLYPRCTRSVSIPIPVEFAHLSAYRARHHIAEVVGSDVSSAVSVSSGGSEERRSELQEHTENLNRILRVNPNLTKRLYYL
ncbi:translation initiation factor 2C-like protein [Leptotrombidium deliense]|uniref:Translation initiation factor 2C-like protein n=1 Tax=Leptotrombidium deliense TaxID=299467 RepID=A0A443SBR9_9ACAR|nr:translation initiation factor 2C-like protein [Leptotrombidium deliense]